MILYDSSGKPKRFDITGNYLEGIMGKLYIVGNECLKLFLNSIDRRATNCFDEDVFTTIMALRLKNFYQLYDLYYNRNLTKIRGYLAKYYEPKEIDILTMPVDYVLNNFYNLYESATKLAVNGIRICDLHDGNVILQDKEIIVIDVDEYHKDHIFNDEKSVLRKNIKAICALFISLFNDALYKYHSSENLVALSELTSELFRVNPIFGADPICKKLSRYKYPIDYLKRK